MIDPPPAVDADIAHGSLRDYWLARARQHTLDSYAGVPMSKFPEDLRVYEHLLWLGRPDTVIELGVQYGGSSLWFRDRLRTLAAYGHIGEPRVIAVERDVAAARDALDAADPEWERLITLIEGDVLDPSVAEEVGRGLAPEARCLVVEDTAHTYETTRAALDGYSGFVCAGGYLVVEDGCVDREEMRLDSSWPRGVLPALKDWLATSQGAAFVRRRDLELYGLTCHPFGYLQRRQ